MRKKKEGRVRESVVVAVLALCCVHCLVAVIVEGVVIVAVVGSVRAMLCFDGVIVCILLASVTHNNICDHSCRLDAVILDLVEQKKAAGCCAVFSNFLLSHGFTTFFTNLEVEGLSSFFELPKKDCIT